MEWYGPAAAPHQALLFAGVEGVGECGALDES